MRKGLGKLQRSFTRDRQSWVALLLALIFLPSGCYVLASGLGLVPGDRDLDGLAGILTGLCLIGVGGGGVLAWVYSLRGRVRLFEDGLEVRRVPVLFDEIESVVGAVALRNRGVPYLAAMPGRLVLADGRELTMPNDLLDSFVLYERIKEAVHGRVRPVVARRIAQGRRVAFGPIRLSSEGLHAGKRTLPWEELHGFSYDSEAKPNQLGFLERGVAKPWKTVNLGEVPNTQLLIDICRECAAAAGHELPLFGPKADEIQLPPLPTFRTEPQSMAPARTAPIVVPRSRYTSCWSSSLEHGFSRIPLGLVCLGTLFALLFGGIALFIKGVPGNESHLIVPALCGLVAVAVGSLIPLFRVRSVVIDADGVAWTRFHWRTKRLWSDVIRYRYSDEVVKSQTTGISTRNARLVIRFRVGSLLYLGLQFRGFDALAREVIRAATSTLLPQARAKMASGVKFVTCQRTPLGAPGNAEWIHLSDIGVRIGGRECDWDEIERVWVGNGQLGWQFRNGWTHEVMIAATWNFDVLLELVRERIGSRCEAPSIL